MNFLKDSSIEYLSKISIVDQQLVNLIFAEYSICIANNIPFFKVAEQILQSIPVSIAQALESDRINLFKSIFFDSGNEKYSFQFLDVIVASLICPYITINANLSASELDASGVRYADMTMSDFYRQSQVENDYPCIELASLRQESLAKNIIKSNFLELTSPISGKLLRSARSLTPSAFVFSDGFDTFIANLSHTSRDPRYLHSMWIYIPFKSLVLDFTPWKGGINQSPRENVTLWKLYEYSKFLFIHRECLPSYFNSTKSSRVYYYVNPHNIQLSHMLFHTYGMLQVLLEGSLLDKVNNIIIPSGWDPCYPSLGEMFEVEEIIEDSSLYSQVFNDDAPAFLIDMIAARVPSNLSYRVQSLSISKTLTEIEENQIYLIDNLHEKWPVILFTLRPGDPLSDAIKTPNEQLNWRISNWVDQDRTIIEACKILKSFYPHLLVILEGRMLPYDEALSMANRYKSSETGDELLERYGIIKKSLEQIGIDCMTTIDHPSYYCTFIDRFVDIFVSPLGSGLSRLSWISGLRGIVHGSPAQCSDFHLKVWSSKAVKSDVVQPFSYPVSKLKMSSNGYSLDPDFLASYIEEILGIGECQKLGIKEFTRWQRFRNGVAMSSTLSTAD
jgi:hypothetical protein